MEHGLVDGEAQSLRRHGENVVLLHGVDGDVGRQSGLQLQVVVGCRDDNLVGDDVALGGGLLAYLGHAALEVVVGESVDGEADALAFLHSADVSLVDVGNNAHIRQVLGDGEQLRRVERGGHRLSLLNGL